MEGAYRNRKRYIGGEVGAFRKMGCRDKKISNRLWLDIRFFFFFLNKKTIYIYINIGYQIIGYGW